MFFDFVIQVFFACSQKAERTENSGFYVFKNFNLKAAGTAMGHEIADPCCTYAKKNERNKIKILLRSQLVYAIIGSSR